MISRIDVRSEKRCLGDLNQFVLCGWYYETRAETLEAVFAVKDICTCVYSVI